MRRWVGVVLIGGQSRRMGRDKAVLDLGHGPLAAVVGRVLHRAGAAEVLAVGGDEERRHAAPTGTTFVPDRWPDAGPLGGIATGLSVAAGDVVAVACDLPGLTPELVGRLRAALDTDERSDVAVARSTRGVEPLVGAWRHRTLGILSGLVEAAPGGLAVHRALDAFRVVDVTVEDAEVANLNRPADVDRFLATSPGVATLRPPRTGEDHRMDVPEIDVDELASRLDADAVLVDVREPDEYREARVPGGTLIPLGEIPERLDEIPSTGTISIVCRSGGRSAQAVAFLREQGVDAVNVAGGTLAWIESGREVDHG